MSEKYDYRTRARNHLEFLKIFLDDSITLYELFFIADILGYAGARTMLT